ncbi:CPBP family intramembrane metalloprotease [Isoptericola sp. b441]|uniref:CPBP family intramembrane metalloprotease n=1 Tax=Actinotalea lenta TaxID=3064654 RepID=A0ABT9D5X0_9CELL|nr:MULTISPECIES: CPBP family intramembrane glutamic endopeptidase [unclassified Isoptericola]MDO8106214.1 CPBP family intramembrane metalloprotease [Isoptericola sp. b441]MDO8122066.1 CPBP family intramembrane metalloprotease [Isoptericola sp. b490]
MTPREKDAPAEGSGPQPAPSRTRLRAEIWIVLGLSLGQAGVYAIVNLADRLTRAQSLGQQTATINPSQSPRPWLDLTYQLLHIGFGLMPVALALFLLAQPAGLRAALDRIGLNARRPGRDLLAGAGLAAVIGIPGLGLYAAGRALGLSVHVAASGLTDHWWTVPVLILSALYNAVLEEVVVVAWLLDRLGRLGWRIPAAIALSALIRGSYHLYQGPAMAVGNVVMGVVFTLAYLRWKRVAPLVVAHFLLDLVSFVGYALVPASLLAALGLS